MPLKIEVIKKIHHNKKLVGYEVMDENGNVMSIDKDAVKSAIQSGKVEVLNMTVTADGRLLGAAKPLSKKDDKPEIEYKLLEVYTHGDSIVGALVDESSAVDAGIIDSNDIAGLEHGYNFETANTVVDRMADNIYSNLEVSDGEVSSNITRVNFADVVDKMVKILRVNNLAFVLEDFKVQANCDGSFDIANPADTDNTAKIRRIVMLIITYKLLTLGINVLAVNDEVIKVQADNTTEDELLHEIIEAFE